MAAQIASEDPANHRSYTAYLVSLRDAVVKDIRPTLLLLFGAAALLLLITCANVAGLLVARSITRARETAVRVALGAARRQLALQYFLEGMVISLIGAALGVCLSFALVRSVLSLAAQYIPRADEVSVNWTVLLFALAAGCLASVLASQAPLWQALRTMPNEALNEGVRGSAGKRSRRLSQSLVVAETALAFTLLAVSALFVAQLSTLLHTWPGFDPGQLLTFQLTASSTQYPDEAKLTLYQKNLLEALQSIPGVRSAAVVNQLPLAGCCFTTTFLPEGRALNPSTATSSSILGISPEYFRTMRIPLRAGRVLNEHDTNEHILPVVINQTAASTYWPGRNPIGAYARLGHGEGTRAQVMGVVGNVRNRGLGDSTGPEVYLINGLFPPNPMFLVLRSPVPEKTLMPEVRAAIRRVDPTQPIDDVRPMNEIVQTSLTVQRLSSFMTAFYAAAALLMAMLGVYGVVSYSVRQRTVEIGTRMALGAVRGDLLRLVIGGGLRMAGLGVLIGGVGAAAATWLVVHQFGLQDVEWASFAYSVAIVAAVATLASFFPAWRATLLSPMVAIRNEPGSMWESAQRGIRRLAGEASDFVSGGSEAAEISGGTVLTNLADATRRAASFSEALHIALLTLSNETGCESAMLLENISGEEYRPVASVPDEVNSDLRLPAQGFLLGRFKFYPWPVPLTPGDFDTWLRWAAEQKPEYLGEN